MNSTYNSVINAIDMTKPNDYTFYVGRIISQNDFITNWRHLFVFYSAGNEVTESLNLHENPVTILFTLADVIFPVNAAQNAQKGTVCTDLLNWS